jgi:hypothetical protein
MPSIYDAYSMPGAGCGKSLPEGKSRSSLWTDYEVKEGCCEPFFGSLYPDDRGMYGVEGMREACAFYNLTAEWDAMWIHYFGRTSPPFEGVPGLGNLKPYRPLFKGKAKELQINAFLHDISQRLRTNTRGLKGYIS